MSRPDNPLKLRAQAAGLTMVERQVIPSTRRAHEAVEFARERGAVDAFHASLLRRYWAEGADLWALSTLRAAAEEAGLPPDELEEAIVEGRYRPVVDASLAEAAALGISAVPTFLVGARYLIQGAQDQRVFRQAMERLGVGP